MRYGLVGVAAEQRQSKPKTVKIIMEATQKYSDSQYGSAHSTLPRSSVFMKPHAARISQPTSLASLSEKTDKSNYKKPSKAN